MIEVEVRGQLTKQECERLQKFLEQNGKFIRHQDREMILLRDYEGYTGDFVGRDMDIRLRNTNGECEIMLKEKVSDQARREVSLKLADDNLDKAKIIVKALGCKQGIWMHRISDIYEYEQAEWSVVEAVPGIYYFEIEQEAQTAEDTNRIHHYLVGQAETQGLVVFSDEDTRRFIDLLEEKVNKTIDL